MLKRKSGAIPFGFYFNAERGQIEYSLKERSVLIRILELYYLGDGVTRIAKKLNEEGLKPRRGNLWTASAITQILSPKRLEFYCWYDYESKLNKDFPMFEKHEYHQMIEERKKDRPPTVRKERNRYLLSGIGILKCGYCNGPVKATVTKIKEKRILYYYCTRKQTAGESVCHLSKLHLQHKIDNLVIDELFEKTTKSEYLEILSHIDSYKTNLEMQLIHLFQTFKSHKENNITQDNVLGLLNDVSNKMETIKEKLQRLTLPTKIVKESIQESILKNIDEIKLYNSAVEIIYKYPINGHHQFNEMIKMKI